MRGHGKVGHIEDIAVAAHAQGKKIGLRIIQALTGLSERAGCYKTILNCSDKNIRESRFLLSFATFTNNCDLAFYEKCGYEKRENEMVCWNSVYRCVIWKSDTIFIKGKVCSTCSSHCTSFTRPTTVNPTKARRDGHDNIRVSHTQHFVGSKLDLNYKIMMEVNYVTNTIISLERTMEARRTLFDSICSCSFHGVLLIIVFKNSTI